MRWTLALALVLVACGGEDDDTPPPVAAEAPAAPPSVVVNASSSPPGARVTGGGRVLGTTPLSVNVPVSAPAVGGAPPLYTFVFELDGYRAATVEAAPIDGIISVSAALSPAASPPMAEPPVVVAAPTNDAPARRPPPAPVDANPFRSGQAWRGSYLCAQGRTNLVLRITGVRGNHVDATFDFNYPPRSVSGAYRMSGDYQPPRRHLTLRAGAWIRRPPGYVTVDMSGRVSDDGHVYSGRITGAPGCSTFRVQR